jgi:hypothetical protein
MGITLAGGAAAWSEEVATMTMTAKRREGFMAGFLLAGYTTTLVSL